MPDAYAHLRTARHAMVLSGYTLPSQNAFLAGANGPDPFFSYRFWESKPTVDLPALAQRLHTERAGEFLLAMARRALSPAQRSYAAGFVMHNTLDSLVHPYVAFLTQKGAVYDRPCGHGYCESALDTALWHLDFGGGIAPLREVCPPLITGELGEVAALLRETVDEVFGIQLPFVAICDSFSHFSLVRWFFRSRFGFKKLIARGIDAVLRKPGFASSHMQPRRPAKGIPNQWINPYTGTLLRGGFSSLLAAAEKTGAARIRALCLYWDGALTEDELKKVLGSASYDTGLPC